jgi:glycosyltransferase involved in cell wall biosynthesis
VSGGTGDGGRPDDAGRGGGTLRHVLILVENLSVPLDRRVWNECRTLTAAGYEVSVVCPRGRTHDRRFVETIAGVRIYRYPAPRTLPGLAGYIWEYGYALTCTLLLALAAYARRPFQAIHACNPPDLFFLIGRFFGRFGVAYLFDHHDANPEILVAKRGGTPGHGFPELVVDWAEHGNFTTAEVVVSPNGSYRDIALGRGGRRPEDVFLVRSAPWLEEFPAGGAAGFDRRGHEFLVGYLGVMGVQDGVDVLVRAAALLVDAGYDLLLYLAGGGESYDDVAALAAGLGIADRVLMPGYQDRDQFGPPLRSADVCVAPDPPGPFNDISTMNKIVEYMALGRPAVAFGLPENRVSGGDAMVYAEEATAEGLAAAIGAVLELGPEREELARRGRRRFEQALAWEHSQAPLLAAYARLEERMRAGAGENGQASAASEGDGLGASAGTSGGERDEAFEGAGRE